MPRLEVKVGADRFHMEPANLNDNLRPNEINSPYFCGRVLVRILNAPGAQQGQPGQEYFTDRTRKFCIQIEGRFRQEWSADDILFGTDFDKFVPFPRAPFNAGMRVARLIDPCTFYEEHPPSGRPYIMSPYLACMNVFCAWPAPDRMEDAVIVFHDSQHDEDLSYTTNPATVAHKSEGDVVPVEHLEHHEDSPATEKKQRWFSLSRSSHDERVTANYWRFVGFRNDPRMSNFLQTLPPTERSGMTSVPQTVAPKPMPAAPAPSMTAPTPIAAPRPVSGAERPTVMPPIASPNAVNVASPASAAMPRSATPPVRTGTPSVGSRIASKSHRLWHGIDKNVLMSLGSSHKSSGKHVEREHVDRPETPRLPEFTTSSLENEADWSDPSKPSEPEPPSGATDAALAQSMNQVHLSSMERTVEQQLGPWRFSDPGADMVEDNAFVFLDKSVSVPERRKHFANLQHRKDFKYDPNVVYGASFFSNLMDFNTFDLAIGPVRINVSPYFQEMPIRYSLRAKHNEEITFCTISFQLVDD
ncbi:hypothetical protein MOBT1_000589 [Malassezia obtusa]|uniref:Domain of unknown function at the cortex 1 domain-containing protein n=1 Tax=Malassezia obtusa TaxID=76774 RepID=A0AAF0IS81_9BASI|nr:hypothetical protein MOBT1_000589 [Malassezia obtusa]